MAEVLRNLRRQELDSSGKRLTRLRAMVPACTLTGRRMVLHVLDERAQLGQGLTFVRVVQKNSGRCDGKRCQERLQSAVGHRRLGERAGQLRKSQTLDRHSEERGVVVRDEWSGDRCLDDLVAIEKGPRG